MNIQIIELIKQQIPKIYTHQYTKKIIKKIMQEPNRQLLQQSHQKFIAGDFNTSKLKLQQINQDDKCIQLNKLLIQFQTCTSDNCQLVLGKLLTMLTQTNIDLYKKNRPKEINFISHQMLYYNIVAIAEYLGKNVLAQLVGSQALFFYKCLQTSTGLMFIYQNLRRSLSQNRLSTALQLIHKFQKIIENSKNFSVAQERLKIMINILFTCTLLKLHMVQQSQALFMLKFEQADAQKFTFQQKNTRTKRKNKIIYKDLMNFLKSQIDFANKNYEKSMNSMLQYSASQSNRQKIYAENNIAINLCILGKSTVSQRIFMNNCEILSKVLTTNRKYGTQLPELFQKTKQNFMLSSLFFRQNSNSPTHLNLQSDQRCYNYLKNTQDLFSFKQQYRRGQCCLNLYHSLLEKSARKLPWQQIHDNYDNVYYFPNQPFYQFKGKNKNLFLANKKPVYRRYVLNQWNDNPHEDVVDKDQNRRKFQKQANSLKLTQTLSKAEQHLKKSLIILQKQQSIIVKIEGSQIDMAKVINQRLYHEYVKFKSSILCLLAYISLCLCKWSQVIKYCEQFNDKKCGQTSPENNYSILTYQMQAFSKLNRIQDAYKTMHTIVSSGLSKTQTYKCRDGSNLSNCNIEEDVPQQINFIHNMAVLHSRNNRIPETHQSIQKILTQINMTPNYIKSQTPLSTQQLLIHYNLRTQNLSGALQIIKKRRIMTVGNPIKPILNITK